MKQTIIICYVSVITVFCFLTAFASENGWLNKNIELTDVNGKKTALLQFGSPIDDSKLTAWMRKGDKTLYSENGRMTYGILYDSDAAVETGNSKQGMREVMIKGFIKSSFISTSMDEALREYEDKYYEICSSCHSAISHRRFSVEQWAGIMNSMKTHAKISDNDSAGLYRYIKLIITE
ncbi:hypothetical protein EP073_03950 [Geovibrio thiophilus]|uniref:Cytochrome C n=1 Tax=Geovibrio thiophilus TaxID=139438 RepID=A0A410JWJ8_9BACT|nr:hypothetical protein [Geovibrio thiophilus]QAR32587.1 hypothetical protein EP073_03950 [Geovibrio thiophilus]